MCLQRRRRKQCKCCSQVCCSCLAAKAQDQENGKGQDVWQLCLQRQWPVVWSSPESLPFVGQKNLAEWTNRLESKVPCIAMVSWSLVLPDGACEVALVRLSFEAKLVIIAHDVDPIEMVVWMPQLCRKKDADICDLVRGQGSIRGFLLQRGREMPSLRAPFALGCFRLVVWASAVHSWLQQQ